eukprot:2016467-Amphidinium_carterae.1
MKPKTVLSRWVIKTDAKAENDAVGIGGFIGILNELGEMQPGLERATLQSHCLLGIAGNTRLDSRAH